MASTSLENNHVFRKPKVAFGQIRGTVRAMKIHPISDVHLEHAPMPQTYVAPDCDVVILAGDICPGMRGIVWANEAFSCPVIYVPGNHDFWDGTEIGKQVELLKTLANPNVHVLYNETVEIDGVQFVGATLWTDFNLTGDAHLAMISQLTKDPDFIRIANNGEVDWFTPDLMVKEHTYSRFFISEAVRSFKDRSVVVTHHAPSEKSIHMKYERNRNNPAYASRLENFMLDLDVPLWVHGHTHDSSDYMIGDTRIVCNPRGYHGEEPFAPNPRFVENLVIEL
jgi:Icc-related predicted phosphoesterase